MNSRTMRLAVGLGSLLATAGFSLSNVQGVFAQQVAPGPTMSIEEVVAQLEAEGYTEVHEIERENGRYEILVSTRDGRTVEIYLDARTGETLKIEQVYLD